MNGFFFSYIPSFFPLAADGFVGSAPNRYRSSKNPGWMMSLVPQCARGRVLKIAVIAAVLLVSAITIAALAVALSSTLIPPGPPQDGPLVVLRMAVSKSPGDPKEYRLVMLRNGLRALLVSSPGAERSGAAVSVGTGSFGDPVTIPGLAHFLEHMLFMGTAKYPNEDEYMKFITDHGGIDNAFTAGEETNYYFDINSDYFEEAVCPIFFFLAHLEMKVQFGISVAGQVFPIFCGSTAKTELPG